MTNNSLNVWSKTPIEGVSVETWGILINAMVDGLALQALIQKDFPVEKTLFKGLTPLHEEDKEFYFGLMNLNKM